MKQNINDLFILNIEKCRKQREITLLSLCHIWKKNMCAESIPSKVVQYEQFLNERLKTDLRQRTSVKE